MAGLGGVPTDGAAAVVVSVTIENPSGAGWAKVNPNPGDWSAAATLHYQSAQSVNDVVVARLDEAGAINIWTQDPADVTIDVAGYYSPLSATWSYAYDGDGLRRSRTAPSGEVTSFTWDPTAGVPALLTETTGADTTAWVYGPGGSPLIQHGPDGTVTYLHHDQLGSVRVLTDAAGDVVGTYTYDPYGNVASHTGADTPLGYAGQYTDDETGFQYLRARFYDPTTGQFLTRDPIEAITREAYGYTYGNPLNATDPSGLWSVDLPGDWCFGTDDDCENPHNGHATPVSQPIVNFAGGALDLNPMFMIAQAVDEPLTGRDIDLAANGVDECSGWYTAGQWSMAIVDVAIPGHAGWTALNSGRGAGIGNFARVARHQAHRAMPSTFKGGPERVARWLAEHPDFRTHWHWTWRGIRSGGK